VSETVLGLMRHGQTDWNIDLRLQGISDIPLNQTGIAQAKSASLNIDVTAWDLILSSPLSRAKDTASFIAERTGLEVVVVPDLMERSFGEAEGLSDIQWRELYEKQVEIPGIETIEQLAKRARSLLDLVSTHYDGMRVLAVSHGSYIRTVLKIASQNQYPKDHDRLGNVSLSILKNFDGSWNVTDYNPESLAADDLK